MKIGFIIAAVIAVIGVYLITLSVSDSEHVLLLGLTLHPRVARGIGIVGLILSLVAGLVAYGSSLPASHVERRRR
jgi:hypothetical protein